MNRNVSGILRIVIAFATVIILFQKFRVKTFDTGGILIIGLIFFMNAIFYMIFNAIKDFRGKHIGLKPAYVIFLIWKIISIHAFFSLHFSGFLAITIVVNSILSYYFIIYDFIQHWSKKTTSLKGNSN